MRAKGVFAAIVCAGFVTGGAADAAIVPFLDAINAEATGFRFTYQVDLQGGHRLDPTRPNPHYFTLYDFAGYVPGSALQPTDWVLTVQPTGTTPSLTSPPDDPGIVNLTWTYTGAAVIGQGLNNEITLGEFSAVSLYSTPNALGAFSAAATKDALSPTEDGTLTQNVGFAPVPAAVPEPSVLLLSAVGGIGLLACTRRRRNSGGSA